MTQAAELAQLASEVTVDTAGNITFLGPITAGKLITGTAVNATGTAIDLTGVPSWASRVTVMMNNVSTNGTSIPLVQLGTSSGFETSGYNSVGNTMNATALGSVAYTAGFGLKNLSAAAEAMFGTLVFSHMGGNIWTLHGMGRISGGAFIFLAAGSKSLAGALTQIRITTVNGTDTYDSGTINIMWE